MGKAEKILVNIINRSQRRCYVSNHDIYYDKPVRNSWDGLPIGNGVMGTQVWIENTAVYMQINRVDLFATNSSTTAPDFDMVSPGYYGTHEYRSGVATLIIDLGVEVAPKGICLQHLSFYNGMVHLDSESFQAEIFMSADCDLLCTRIIRKVPSKIPISFTVEALREEHIVRNNHQAHTWFDVHQERNDIDMPFQVLRQRFEEKAEYGFVENDHYMESALIQTFCSWDGTTLPVEIKSACFPGRDRLRNSDLDYTELIDELLKNRSKLAQRIFTFDSDIQEIVLYVATAVSDDHDIEVVKEAHGTLTVGTSRGYNKLREIHRSWWHDFWDRSYIAFKAQSLFDRYLVTNLYYIGSSMRGKYPAQYNGLLWNTQGDLAFWGGQYWWYNTGRNFYCLDKLGHGELARPLFNMLSRNIPRYTMAARQQWKCDGIYFPETDAFNGPERLTDHIAEELFELLMRGTMPGSTFLNHIKSRSGMPSRWALFLNKSEQQKGIINNFGWHSNLVYNAGDVANIMWEHYLHTRDRSFLETVAYPWMEGVAQFYVTFPGLVKEEDGKYHLYQTGWAESIASARDVIDDLVVIRGLFPTLFRAAEILRRRIPFETKMRDVLESLTPYPDSENADVISLIRHPDGQPTYAIARNPVRGHQSNGCSNDCRLRMTFLFDLVNLESKVLRSDEWQKTMHSLEACTNVKEILNDAHPTHREWGYVWNRTVLKAARMGRTDLVEKGLPALLRQFTMPNHYGQHKRVWKWPNRMPWTNEVQSSSIQEMGAMSDCLQEPLMQCISPHVGGEESVIHVFPAWPTEWDVEFQLHSRDDFDVYARQQGGRIESIVIDSFGGKTCRIRNPWPEIGVVLTCRETGQKHRLQGGLLVFQTDIGKSYILQAENKTSAPCYMKDVEPVFLFDQVSVQLPFYEGLPTLAPGENTVAMLSEDVEGITFESSDEMILKVATLSQDGKSIALLTGAEVGETKIRALVDNLVQTEAIVKVEHTIVNDYDPDILFSGTWESWWYTICHDGTRQEHLLYGKSGRENNSKDCVEDAGSYFLDSDSLKQPRPWYDDYHFSSEVGAYYEYVFCGRGIEIIGLIGPDGGEGEVFIDSVSSGIFNCKNPEKAYQQTIFKIDGLEEGLHKVKVVVAGTGVVYLDALRIL